MSETAFPPAPLTLEGSAILHQMLRFKWGTPIPETALKLLSSMQGNTAAFSMLGHKGDLMLVHFRNSLEELNQVEQDLGRAGLYTAFEQVSSYVSVVELGLYESTGKFYAEMAEKGIAPYSEEWESAAAEILERSRKAMAVRLYPEIPPAKYICFYPMDRKRGEVKNWYSVPMKERSEMMHVHGMNGRRYAGKVRQVISGSIGWDDWEWGVDLFADEALDFKRLIYEMRFDEVSAEYALFGPFYVGVRRQMDELSSLFR